MAKSNVKLERLVAKWKKLHVESKLIEPALKATRTDVATAITDAGGEPIVTKLGTIGLRTKTECDYKALAIAQLGAAKVEELKPKFMNTSEPFVSAPTDWVAEARASAD